MVNIVVIQRTLTHYRRKLFQYIAKENKNKFNLIIIHSGNLDKNNKLFKEIYIKSKIYNLNIGSKSYQIFFSKDIIKKLKEINTDVVILEGMTNIINNIFISRYCKKNNIPYIWWEAGRRKGAKMTLIRKLAQPISKKIMDRSNACIAYSTLAKNYMVNIGIDENKIFICQNTLNVSYFDEQLKNIDKNKIIALKNKYCSNGEKILLYVGALEKRKRIKDLIDAVTLINNIKYKLLIIGDGNYRNQLEIYVRQNELKNIEFLGKIIDNVIEYFVICDLFILPSEGGLALNQAMICSKPLLASSADGTELDLIINGINGYIFEEGNISQLAEFIIKICTNNEEREKMGIESRRIIDEKVNERIFNLNLIKAINYALLSKN